MMVHGNCPKYFSYTVSVSGAEFDEGYKTHWVKQEAIDRCKKCIQEHRNEALDGWDEDAVSEICWGEIRQQAQEIHHKETPGGYFDYQCDYVLRGVKRPKKEADA